MRDFARQEVDPSTPLLLWEKGGEEMTSSGKELKNKALEEALKNNKFAFTLDEFEEFNVPNVDPAESYYIIVQGKYYKPAALKQDDNFMLQFLRYGKLAYVFGSNLFVHGAIDERNMGIVPGRKEPVQNVHEWADALNIWSRREVEAFEENPYHHANSAYDDKGTQSAGLYRARSGHYGTLIDGTLTAGVYRERNGNALMDYGVPNGNACTHLYTHINTCARAYAHTHAHTHTRTYTHTRVRTHTCTHAHMHTHTCSHTHSRLHRERHGNALTSRFHI